MRQYDFQNLEQMSESQEIINFILIYGIHLILTSTHNLCFRVPTIYVLSRNMKNIRILYLKIFIFFFFFFFFFYVCGNFFSIFE